VSGGLGGDGIRREEGALEEGRITKWLCSAPVQYSTPMVRRQCQYNQVQCQCKHATTVCCRQPHRSPYWASAW